MWMCGCATYTVTGTGKYADLPLKIGWRFLVSLTFRGDDFYGNKFLETARYLGNI